MSVLKAPFPWIGGKSRIADEVWGRFGDVDNYIEPFAGSLAVLLRRPHGSQKKRAETVNDKNHFVANFWRAVSADPDAVARYCDWPVSEIDLHARHRWLVRSEQSETLTFRRQMLDDPSYFDAKFAGWWCWGQCLWIGGGWCVEPRPEYSSMPELSRSHGKGVANESQVIQIPKLSSHAGCGPHSQHGQSKRPALFNGSPGSGWGVMAGEGCQGNRPQLADAFDLGRGVSANWVAGTCEQRREWLTAWMRRLADRLRLVRTCYGEWDRICDSPSTLTRLGTTGVFLDPPYPTRRGDTGEPSRSGHLYATDRINDLDALRDQVLAWCERYGADPLMRIAVCGYEGDGYESLEQAGWNVWSWKASGGYGNQKKNKSNDNANRERVWFSPACQPVDLFSAAQPHKAC